MSCVVPGSARTGAGNAAAWSAEVATAQAGDVIVVLAAYRAGGTLAVSGYTGLSTQQNNDNWRSRPFVMLASGGETSAAVSTGHSGSTYHWITFLVRGTNVSAVADAIDGVAYLSGSTGQTVSSPSLTTGTAACTLAHWLTFDSSDVLMDPGTVRTLIHTPPSGGASGAGALADAYQSAAGAIPQFNWISNTTANSGLSWVIAFIDGSSSYRPVTVNDGRTLPIKFGGFETLTASLPDSVTGLTTIDGVIMNTVANTISGAVTVSVGQPTTSPWPFAGVSIASNESVTAEAWVGRFFAFAATTDLSNKNIVIPVGFDGNGTSARVGEKGLILVLADASNNWAAYSLVLQKRFVLSGATYAVVRVGGTTPLGNSGDPSAAATKYGIFYHRKTGTTTSVAVYAMPPTVEAAQLSVIRGGSSNPITLEQVAISLLGGATHKDVAAFQGAGQLINRIGVTIGDGSTSSVVKLSASSYETPAVSDVQWVAGASSAGLTLYPSNSCTFDLASGILRTSTRQSLTWHASSGTSGNISTTALSIVGPWDVTWKTGIACQTVTFDGCYPVALKGASATDCTIKNTLASSSQAAVTVDADGSTLLGCTVDVTGTSAGYHLELGTAVTAITLTDVTFTGTPGTDKVHVLKTSGTVTITISGTTTLVAGDVTSAGATVVIAAPSPTLDATVLSGSRVVLYNDTTAAELDNTAPAGTSWSKVITSGASSGDTLTLHVFKEGYEEFSTSFIYAGIDNTLLVSQSVHAAIASLRTELSITDYTTITEFTLDITGTVEIDADDADGSTTKARLAIWYNGVLTTENGARYLRGAISVLSTAAIRINTSVLDLKIENISVTYGLNFTDTERRLYRDDGAAIYAPASAPGSIQNDYSGVPDTVETGVSGLTGSESAQLMGLPSATTIAAAVWAYVITGSTTAVQMMRGFAAMLLGKVSGAGTATEVFRDISDTKDVATFTVDSSGNRTAVTRDLT